MNRRLAELLDHCIEDVRRGRATPEECLAAHPEHARELAPLLRLALHLDPAAVPEPDAEARQRMAGRIRAGVVPVARRAPPWWQALTASSHIRFALGAAIALVLLTMAGAGGLGAASRHAVPGDQLYGLKGVIEGIELSLRFESAVDKHARLSDRRLEEVRTLAQRGDLARLPEALARYERERDAMIGAAMNAPAQEEQHAMRVAARQVTKLDALKDTTPAAAEQIAAANARLADRLPALATLPHQRTTAGGQAQETGGPSTAAHPRPAATALTVPAAGTDAVRDRAATVSRVLADLQRVIDAAEAQGALTHSQAQELRVLVLSAAVLGLGGDNAVVIVAASRLMQAIALCAARNCAPPDTLDQLATALSASALALGVPLPALPAAHAITPTPAATAATVTTTTTAVPRAAASVSATPSPPATAAVIPPPSPSPPLPPSPVSLAPTPATETASAAATTTPAPGAATPASPTRPPVTAPPTPTATRTSTPSSGTAGVAAAPAASPTSTPTPITTPTPTPTRTPTPTLTPSPTPTPTPVPSPTPAVNGSLWPMPPPVIAR